MDLKKYYSKLNNKCEKNYEKDIAKIKIINSVLAKASSKETLFLLKISDMIIKFYKFEKKMDSKFFEINSFEKIQKEFDSLSKELKPKYYKTSYLNPDYSAEIFGEKIGKIAYVIYYYFKQYRSYAFEHKIYQMERYNRLFLELHDFFNSKKKFTGKFLKELVSKYERRYDLDETLYSYKEMFGKEFTHYKEIILNSNPKDFRYLYRYNINITKNEIKTAEFFKTYSKKKLDILAKQIIKAYEQGFINNGKDLSIKSSVLIRFSAGQEELIKRLIHFLQNDYGLDSIVGCPSATPVNKQISSDLKFVNAVFFDKEFADKKLELTAKVYKKIEDDTDAYSGIILVESFGEKPFSPDIKQTAWSYSGSQQKAYQYFMNMNMQLRQKYIPRTENSFCIIAFPSPEIGNNFEDIFEDILEVNMLESSRYEKIQKNIIDAIDKADTVHIKGKNGNLTDIIIKNQKLQNPRKHTNYCNCGADVNIPVGEVFTSPQLKGTNGTLHIKETFLNGLKFKELKLDFKDGFISDYGCKNFKKDEDNKKFIRENLIFPHKTLPIGEFAIGTNTLAYVIAQKYKILDVLPVLIIEKMGPHFAIGDTCFSHEEDKAVFNPIDNKEITARDNEMTLNRKTDHSKAYTGVHTDITLPYEDIEFITGISEDGRKIEIIRNGRFAVKGSEELNIPLDKFGI
ncbi:MAG: aminopeptidase [Candidatus Delongbacteria bacterium]|nr:aminopeptidase [Candidatus Delongbacteria bacterium]MCG2760519.1 aminopeptidase [Candidatus Delongbacteria bacterium]